MHVYLLPPPSLTVPRLCPVPVVSGAPVLSAPVSSPALSPASGVDASGCPAPTSVAAADHNITKNVQCKVQHPVIERIGTVELNH